MSTSTDVFPFVIDVPTQGLLDAAPDAMFVVTERGHIVAANRQAVALFGYSDAELVNRPIEMLLPERYRASHVGHRENFFRKPTVRSMGTGRSLRAVNKNGHEFPVDISISPLEADGALLSLCSVRDVTARERGKQELEERLRFERLIADISARFVGLPANEIDGQIENVLQQVGEFLDVDRAALGEFTDDKQSLCFTHCWAAEGCERYPKGFTLKSTLLDLANLIRGDVVSFSHPLELPGEVERVFCHRWRIKSDLAMPLCVAGESIGVIAWETVREHRLWTESVIHRAKLAVEIFANALKRKQAERALRESELRFHQLAENIDQVFWFIALDPIRVLYVSPAFERIWEVSARELYQDPEAWVKIIHENDRRRVQQRFADWVSGRRDHYDIEYRIVNPSGRTRWILDRGAAIHGNPDELRWATGIAEDISQRKEAEQKLKTLGGRLIHAQEQERARIARELHDDMNQQLALFAVELEMLAQSPPDSSAEIGRRIMDLAASVKKLSSGVHRLSHRLHPSKLDRLGLAKAVNSLCQELSTQYDIRIGWSHDGIPRSLPSELALNLFRVVQEALQNVVKHSGAKEAEVCLTMTDDSLHLEISDSGHGFDPESVAISGGIGLVSMDERVRFIGGDLLVDSQPGDGSRIHVRVPLTRAHCRS